MVARNQNQPHMEPQNRMKTNEQINQDGNDETSTWWDTASNKVAEVWDGTCKVATKVAKVIKTAANTVWSWLKWPFKKGHEWVQKNPPPSYLKEYLNQMELKAKNGSVTVGLKDTNFPHRVLSTTLPTDASFEEGVVRGFELCRKLIIDVRSSDIYTQTRMIKLRKASMAQEAKAQADRWAAEEQAADEAGLQTA